MYVIKGHEPRAPPRLRPVPYRVRGSPRTPVVPSHPEPSRAVPSRPERPRRMHYVMHLHALCNALCNAIYDDVHPERPQPSPAVPSHPEPSPAVPSRPEPSPAVPSRPQPSRAPRFIQRRPKRSLAPASCPFACKRREMTKAPCRSRTAYTTGVRAAARDGPLLDCATQKK